MGSLGQKTLDKLSLYAVNHYNVQDMGFSPEMQVRILIAEQLFQAYATGKVPKTTLPRKVIGNIAERVYRTILNSADSDPRYAAMRDACGIKEGVKRSYFELTNDIQAYDLFCHHWGVDTSNHAKAVCEEAAYALIEMGNKNNDSRALASGYDRLSKLHNDFQQEAEDFANTADTEIEFIADVKLIRPDAENFSRKEIEAFKKKYGGFVDKNGIEELIQTEEGVYESIPEYEEDEEDFFERRQRELLGGK